MPAFEWLPIIGPATALAGVAAAGVGWWRYAQRRAAPAGMPRLAPAIDVERTPPAVQALTADDAVATQQMVGTFLAWRAAHPERDDLWAAFDQLLREMLTAVLGTQRVRCYRVDPGSATLQSIASVAAGSVAPDGVPQAGLGLRAGLLGHVVTTGQEYADDATAPGPLLQALAAAEAEPWTWIFPIRTRDGVRGLVAVADPVPGRAVTRPRRALVGDLVTLFWKHVECVTAWQLGRQTDKATGLLTRNDFFEQANQALEASYHGHEPVVVLTVSLEGLRRLDDGGRWQDRDDLLGRLGRLFAQRVRSDDLVGRFADDRFVVLLRRLDSGLGRLIAQKLLATANECIAERGQLRGHVRLRIGLAGSGFGHPTLDDLLAKSFEAVDRARHENHALATDLGVITQPASGGM